MLLLQQKYIVYMGDKLHPSVDAVAAHHRLLADILGRCARRRHLLLALSSFFLFFFFDCNVGEFFLVFINGGSHDDAKGSIFHSYTRSMNAFAAMLTPEEADKVSGRFHR